MDSIFAFLDEKFLINWLKGLPEFSVYFFLVISSIIENVFPPWPGDTVTVFGGVMSAWGLIKPVHSMIALIIGNLIGAFIMYYAGASLLALVRRLQKRGGPGFFVNTQMGSNFCPFFPFLRRCPFFCQYYCGNNKNESHTFRIILHPWSNNLEFTSPVRRICSWKTMAQDTWMASDL